MDTEGNSAAGQILELERQTAAASSKDLDSVSVSSDTVPLFWHRAKASWCEFARDSGFNGFPNLVNSTSYWERTIWLIVIGLFLGFTFFNVNDTIAQYNRHETVTKVTVGVEDNDTFGISPVVCIGLDAMQLANYRIYTNETRTKLLLNDFGARFDSGGDLYAFLANVSKSPTAGGLETTSDETLREFVGLTVQHILNIVYLGMSVWVNGNVSHSNVHYGVRTFDIEQNYYHLEGGPVPGKTAAAMKLMRDFYVDRNISLGSMLGVAGSLLCKRFNPTVKCHVKAENGTPVNSSTFSLCDPSRVTWLGFGPFNKNEGHYLCLNASMDDQYTLKFKTEADTCSINIRYNNVFAANTPERIPNAHVLLELSGSRVVARNTNKDFLISNTGEFSGYLLKLLGHYERTNTPDSPCSEQTSIIDCRGRCRAMWMAENCGCWPAAWAFPEVEAGRPKVPYCGQGDPIPEYEGNYSVPNFERESCMKLQTTYDLNPDCRAKCFRKCSKMLYTAEKRVMNDKLGVEAANTTGFLLRFDFLTSFHPLFQEQPLMSENDLLAALGGNLGFWLGACVVSIVHFVVVLIKLVIYTANAVVRKVDKKKQTRKFFGAIRRKMQEKFTEKLVNRWRQNSVAPRLAS